MIKYVGLQRGAVIVYIEGCVMHRCKTKGGCKILILLKLKKVTIPVMIRELAKMIPTKQHRHFHTKENYSTIHIYNYLS